MYTVVLEKQATKQLARLQELWWKQATEDLANEEAKWVKLKDKKASYRIRKRGIEDSVLNRQKYNFYFCLSSLELIPHRIMRVTFHTRLYTFLHALVCFCVAQKAKIQRYSTSLDSYCRHENSLNMKDIATRGTTTAFEIICPKMSERIRRN
ncbi:hypothetical protein TNCV_3694891 [Trichonephila clavipes]|nr:hypothetical protein TNCV_3694891 [Trichonephila clavipes]